MSSTNKLSPNPSEDKYEKWLQDFKMGSPLNLSEDERLKWQQDFIMNVTDIIPLYLSEAERSELVDERFDFIINADIKRREEMYNRKWEFDKCESEDEYLKLKREYLDWIVEEHIDRIEMYGPDDTIKMINEDNSKAGRPLVCLRPNDKGGRSLDLLDDYNKTKAMGDGVDHDKNIDTAERKAVVKPKKDNINRGEDIFNLSDTSDKQSYENNKSIV